MEFTIRSSNSGRGKRFFSKTSRWALRPTHSPVQWIKGKGKAVQLQAWTGPEDSMRLRLPYLKTIGT